MGFVSWMFTAFEWEFFFPLHSPSVLQEYWHSFPCSLCSVVLSLSGPLAPAIGRGEHVWNHGPCTCVPHCLWFPFKYFLFSEWQDSDKFSQSGYISLFLLGENAKRGSNPGIGYKIARKKKKNIPIKGLKIRDVQWFPLLFRVSTLFKTSSSFRVLFRKWSTRMMYRPQWDMLPHPPPPGGWNPFPHL